jgi:hypothetical protein
MARKTPVEESIERLAEEKIYEKVYEEVASGVKREGLWFKALSESGGEETKAKALYVKLRVRSLIDELIVTEKIQQNTHEIEQAQTKETARYNKKMLRAANRQDTFDGIRTIVASIIFMVAGTFLVMLVIFPKDVWFGFLIPTIFFGLIGYLLFPPKR